MSEGPRLLEQVVAPLVNTNEPESQVVELSVSPYSAIAAGQPICVLETSKATATVEAGHDGHIGELHVELMDMIAAGDPICEIYDALPSTDAVPAAAAIAAPAKGAPRLTRKAERRAREAGLDLALLPADRFVTLREVEELIARSAPPAELDPALLARVHAGSVVIFGGGGLGKCLIESLRGAGGDLEPLCVVDDGLTPGSEVLGVPVVGGRAQLPALAAAGVGLAANGVGAIGRIQLRIDIFRTLEEAGLRPATVIDRDASVSESARIGEGAQVFPKAVVSTDVRIGRGVIVNTSVIVSHDCRIGDFAHLAPGAMLAGDVSVGEASLVGMGVTAPLGLQIGARCVIGNGATLTADVPDDTIVSAGSVWSG